MPSDWRTSSRPNSLVALNLGRATFTFCGLSCASHLARLSRVSRFLEIGQPVLLPGQQDHHGQAIALVGHLEHLEILGFGVAELGRPVHGGHLEFLVAGGEERRVAGVAASRTW